MGMVAGNVLTLVSSRCDEKIFPGEMMGAEEPLAFELGAVRDVSQQGEQEVQMDSTENPRIKALERELAHLRDSLDQMVHQKTELLERRLSIMEYCNSTLGENYHKMHRMYIDLLEKTQA